MKDIRNFAEKIIKKHKFIPIRSENWPPEDEHVEEVCRRYVRTSQICLFILNRKDSYMVRKEFNEAEKYDIPRLVLYSNATRREDTLEDFLEELRAGSIFCRRYHNLNEFGDLFSNALSNTVYEKFMHSKENSIINDAKRCCVKLRVNVKAKFAHENQDMVPEQLDSIRLMLNDEILKIEKVLWR